MPESVLISLMVISSSGLGFGCSEWCGAESISLAISQCQITSELLYCSDIMPLPPGVHSRAWLVATTRGSWVAKLSNPGSDPLPKLERQIQLSIYLNQHVIRAPQILALSNGSFI